MRGEALKFKTDGESSMCGRFTLYHRIDDIAERFGVEVVAEDRAPSYNIAPTQQVLAVSGDGERTLGAYRWGLVPFWAKDPTIGNRMINARAETVAEKPAYKHAFRRRRCLVPADGFYEWKNEGGRRTPMHIRFRDARLFAFAGLWEEWASPDGEPLRTCTLITVDPNPLVAPIHDRMPAILRPDEEEVWLDPGSTSPAELLALLRPHPEEEMEAYAVSRAVNSPSHDDPGCIEPAGGD